MSVGIMQIYGDSLSGNCYKLKLVLSMLEIEHEWIEVDILAGDTQKPTFIQKNPNGKIPLLVLDDGSCLSESNAILHYLAAGHDLTGKGTLGKTQVLQWQFFEQYSHEPYIAVARFIKRYLGLPEDRRDEFYSKQAGGLKALSVMEQRLNRGNYLVGDNLTLADISLYAYTHVAEEGGFSLDAFPGIRAWLGRIENTPGYVPMEVKAE